MRAYNPQDVIPEDDDEPLERFGLEMSLNELKAIFRLLEAAFPKDIRRILGRDRLNLNLADEEIKLLQIVARSDYSDGITSRLAQALRDGDLHASPNSTRKSINEKLPESDLFSQVYLALNKEVFELETIVDDFEALKKSVDSLDLDDRLLMRSYHDTVMSGEPPTMTYLLPNNIDITPGTIDIHIRKLKRTLSFNGNLLEDPQLAVIVHVYMQHVRTEIREILDSEQVRVVELMADIKNRTKKISSYVAEASGVSQNNATYKIRTIQYLLGVTNNFALIYRAMELGLDSLFEGEDGTALDTLTESQTQRMEKITIDALNGRNNLEYDLSIGVSKRLGIVTKPQLARRVYAAQHPEELAAYKRKKEAVESIK